MRIVTSILLIFLFNTGLLAQKFIPGSYSNLGYDEKGQLYFIHGSTRIYADTTPPRYTIQQMIGAAKGTETGIAIDFMKPELKGIVYYGLLPFDEPKHPMPVYKGTAAIDNGKAELNIKQALGGLYDMTGWQTKKKGSLGYRVIDAQGKMLYDGVVSFSGTGPFELLTSVYQGPFVNDLRPNAAKISFSTDYPSTATITVNKKDYLLPVNTNHELEIDGLKPSTKYEYTLSCNGLSQSYHFTTAPTPGARKPFVFAYTSDSRKSPGGGERDIYGTNAYMMKKIAAVALQHNARFMQFTGDMADGYVRHKEELELQLINWKKAIQPFWHYMPVYVGMGNHEALIYAFRRPGGGGIVIDKFPYETESAEATFGRLFVNPMNGPESEDGSKYDPNPSAIDFPSYKRNVFYYTYDNVAMVVLNSNYWFAPGLNDSSASGGLHGYLMDNQIKWLEEVIAQLEADKTIDHIFLTQHTPSFPNGGHVGDDMWYRGNNNRRTIVAGKPVDKGIIERRDEYLDILINKSKKVLAILTGDEHNYNRLKLTSEVPIHPEGYPHKKLVVSRPIYQINNGAAGAPYYGQEQAPWSAFTKAFSVQNAICLFYVDGKKVKMKVINPDALNLIDEIQLR
jgi:3',5'-cyclic AMP phosphodiesterase CpdA